MPCSRMRCEFARLSSARSFATTATTSIGRLGWYPCALVEFQKQRGPFRPESAGVIARVLRTKHVAHSADSAAEPNPGVATTLGGARSIVGVPMLKEDELVGAIVIYRQEVLPFTEKQIELREQFRRAGRHRHREHAPAQ